MAEIKQKAPSRGTAKIVEYYLGPGESHSSCGKRRDGVSTSAALNVEQATAEENPLAKPVSKAQRLTLRDYIARHKIAFLVALNVFLIVVLFLRR
jgi:hypothetical protein